MRSRTVTYKSIAAILPALGMLGCLSATGDDAAIEEGVTRKSSALSFGTINMTPDRLDWIQQIAADIEERKKNPYVLRVSTCDKTNAESNDPVFVNVNDQGSSREVAAGKLGAARGKASEIELTGYAPVDPKKISGLTIRKSGNDAWCISRVELWRKGSLIWRYDDGDPDLSYYDRDGGSLEGSYRGLQPTKGEIWLDNESAHAPSRSVVFSDELVPMPPPLSTPLGPLPGLLKMRPLEIEVHTCSDVAAPQIKDPVQAILQHDGITESITLDNPGSDRDANDRDRYVLNEHGFNSLGSLQLRKSGTHPWCISSISVLVAGEEVVPPHNQRIILNSDPNNPNLAPATSIQLNKTAVEPSQAEDWYYPGLPLQTSRYWSYEHGAKGQPCRACEPGAAIGLVTCKRCDSGLACGDDVCEEAGGANQLCNPPHLSPIDFAWKPEGCDTSSLECAKTGEGDRRCVADAGKNNKNCRDDDAPRGPCDVDPRTNRQLICDPIDRTCFLPGTEGNACRADATCDGKLVCGAERKCIDPQKTKARWFKAFQSCRPGSNDCNVCAPNVKAQFDRAAGNDQKFATDDGGEEMTFRDGQWNFNWKRDYAPSGRNPNNVFTHHVQGFVRTNNDRYKYAGTYSNDDEGGGGIFIIEQNSNGVKHMVNMHGARHWHPSGLSAFGKYLVFSDAPNEVRLIDINRRAENHLIAWKAPGMKRAGGGIGIAKLEGGSHLMVVSPSGSKDGSHRNVRFYHLSGDLEDPQVKSVGDWQYEQPSSWRGDYRYTENLSVISECDTGDIYTVNTNKDGLDGYWLLSKVVNVESNGKSSLELQPLKAYFQNSQQRRCSLRASATVWINDQGEIEPLCSERASINGWFDGNDDTLRFRYGVF